MVKGIFLNFSTPTLEHPFYPSTIPRSTATGRHFSLIQNPCDTFRRLTLVSELQNEPDDSNFGGIEFQLTDYDFVSKRRIPIAIVVRCPATPPISNTDFAEPVQDGLFGKTDSLTDLLGRKTLFFVNFGDKFGRDFSR